MLNHSHSRADSRSPFLLHGLPPPHAAAAAESTAERRDRMDPPSSSGRGPTTPRRQLQGPRPPRLNVRMESHAIKKPSGSGAAAVPAAPPARRDQQLQQQQQPQRAPVIIYDASPKVIHVKPSEFMALVQSLTGPGSGAPQQQQQQHYHHHHQAGDDDDDVLLLGQTTFLPPELLLSPSAAMSPAARLATIERSVRPMAAPAPDYDMGVLPGGDGVSGRAGDDDGTLAAVLGPARHPSILSPLPSSLPPAAASGLFSPLPFDSSNISWLNELSPILRAASTSAAAVPGASASAFAAAATNGGSRPPPPAYYSDPFVPSPRNLLATPTVPSPATFAEFFGSLPDL
ncbi:hypothetical protein SETIT_7G094400v2 [Setaria italica]|uniref:VQ domain-containing protein n=2 Tax=Setaria italica TaxID=4555 RepID=A0A368RTY3_SETIT|nr:protein MKS1 [Setaria italica]RCV33591.1 hypothetical protein SETIT_7G094400v2 [Setaria italica]